jgi:hypothetical protein
MHIADRHPPKCHCCKMPSSQLEWHTAFWLLFQALRSRLPVKLANPPPPDSTSPSKAHQRYKPSTTSASTSINSTSGTVQGTLNLSSNPPACRSTGSQVRHNTGGNETPADSLWVVFGIRDMRGFDAIENIETHARLNDTLFFQDMKTRHGRYRWFFQRWFSPYRFRYCRFVQASRIPELGHSPGN